MTRPIAVVTGASSGIGAATARQVGSLSCVGMATPAHETVRSG